MRNNILCVINSFYNYEHIAVFFDSIYVDYIDYVVLENYSKNSDQIKDYFKGKRIITHLRSEENVTHGTMDYFLENYKELIKEYEYLILTDADLLVEDIDSYIDEAKSVLDMEKVMVCGISLCLNNLPLDHHPESINWVPKGVVYNKYIISVTGTHMLLIKNKDLNVLFELKNIIDSSLWEKVCEKDGLWVRTLKNKAKHLTWDYYYPGNEYYEYKRNNEWVQKLHNKKPEIIKLR